MPDPWAVLVAGIGVVLVIACFVYGFNTPRER